jgi:hypothetical protein
MNTGDILSTSILHYNIASNFTSLWKISAYLNFQQKLFSAYGSKQLLLKIQVSEAVCDWKKVDNNICMCQNSVYW